MTLTRRGILKGLAAGSIAATAGCCSTSSSPAKGARETSAALQRLNVVIHGLCIISVNPASPQTGLQLVIPTIMPPPALPDPTDHQYLAGNLDKTAATHALMVRNLQKVDKKQYSLKGVNPGGATDFSPVLNVLFPVSAGLSISNSETRQFTLPLPTACYPLALRQRDKGQRFLIIKPPYNTDRNAFLTVIATAQLFVYDNFSGTPSLYNETDRVDFGWTPNIDGAGIATLHIYQEPAKPVGPTHAIKAYKVLMSKLSDNGHTMDNYYSFDSFTDGTMLDVGGVGSFPGIDDFDKQHLSWFYYGRAGEVANCVSAVVFP